ncbi:MAG: xanthine dehydrogenase family protein subunit M [Pseudonocardiales bacterium]|nr:xanthine dehydrogenase family protein subunit M [Pseudonocardiales bacterium]MBV9729168.1 xanthine dehydrogenase family protein subunit M [Pseudonocardiales bacterium]
MYPSRFHYEAPRTLDEALDLLQAYGDEAKVLAGGQSLIPLIKLRFAAPAAIIDINNISGLDYHEEDSDGSLYVGALCRHRTLERSPLLRSKHPTMSATAPLISDPMVRSRGTLVGSLCHADPQGDWASVMLALGGEIIARSTGGERVIPVSQFVVGPFQNALQPGEIAVRARVPAPRGTRSGTYLKLERRVGDFATVGLAVALETSGGTINRAGLALTGVGPSNIQCTAAEQALAGKTLNASTIDQAARLAAEAAQPKTDVRGSAEFKRHVVYTFVTRALSNPQARAA